VEIFERILFTYVYVAVVFRDLFSDTDVSEEYDASILSKFIRETRRGIQKAYILNVLTLNSFPYA